MFTLRSSLPAADTATARVRSADGCIELPLTEDAAPVRRLPASMLSSAGCRVREVSDAARGFASWREHRLDLTIVDLGLVDNHAVANPQALHRLAGTAAPFGWVLVATAVEGFAAALASGRGVGPAGAQVIAAVEAMA